MNLIEHDDSLRCPACRCRKANGASTLTTASVYSDGSGRWRMLAICEYCGVVHDGSESFDTEGQARRAFDAPLSALARGVRVRWRSGDPQAPRRADEGEVVALVPAFRSADHYVPEGAPASSRRFETVAPSPRYLLAVQTPTGVEYRTAPARSVEPPR